MAKITILIALLPHLLCTMVQGQPSSCSKYFTYMTKHGITDMLGQIKIPPPSVDDEFHLRVALTTATEWPSQVVRLELAQSIQESILAVSFGKSLLYHVYYPTHEPIPSLSAIWFNNHRYCPANGNISATIELGHILYPVNEQSLVYSYGQQISQPWHRNSSIYRIDNPSYDRLLNYDYGLNECGITSYYTDDTNRLIPNGDKIYPGQWPWLVAIFVQDTDDENKYSFACAGSILTNRHVITVKVCISRWNETLGRVTFIEPQRVYVSFGQLISPDWHENHTGIINRVVAKYTSNNILMILNLKTFVEFNAFIRPVCLWSNSTDFQDIINMTGYIVGWGREMYRNASVTEVYRYTGEPRMVQFSFMDVHESIFGTDKTFVLRYSPASDVYGAPIDIGGGCVVFNITTGRYQLRGVMFRVPDFNSLYYIDLAHYLSWIRDQISIT